jgi:hypothetical protein
MDLIESKFSNFCLFKKQTFPKQLNNLIQNSKQRLLYDHRKNEQEHKYIKDMLILNELILPDEFLDSILNNEFYFGNVESQPFKFHLTNPEMGNYNLITNRLYLFFNSNEMNIYELDEDILFDLTFKLEDYNDFMYNKSYCSNCSFRNKKCMYVAIDIIQGLPNTFDYSLCDLCYENTEEFDILKLPKDVSNIVKKYVKSIYKFSKYDSDKQHTYTSTLFDWVCFCYLNREENSLYWLINCNKKSKFYGYILMYGHQSEFEIINHVRDFIKLDFYIPYFKKLLQ